MIMLVLMLITNNNHNNAVRIKDNSWPNGKWKYTAAALWLSCSKCFTFLLLEIKYDKLNFIIWAMNNAFNTMKLV